MSEPIAGVVFDLDGTLIDSAPDIHSSLNGLLGEEGRESLSLDAVRMIIGDGTHKLVQNAFRATGTTPEGAELDALVQRFFGFYHGAGALGGTILYPGVIETLELLRQQGLRLGVCTNKYQIPTDEVLAGFKIDGYFDAVAGADAVPARKPDPDHVRVVLNRLGVAASAAVMVGDSPNDVSAGRGAGLPVVAVSYGYSKVAPEALGADIVIDRFDKLPEALRQLAGSCR